MSTKTEQEQKGMSQVETTPVNEQQQGEVKQELKTKPEKKVLGNFT